MFPQRRPGVKTRGAMADASLRLGMDSGGAETKEAEGAISALTGHRYANTMATGDCAILAALTAIGGKVALPDQGIWRGFKRHAGLLGIEVVEIKTELGLLDVEALLRALKEHAPKVLCISSLAGYMAEQPIPELSEACRASGCLLLEDASGGIGGRGLAASRYSDVIVCSAGTPKVLNLVTGGFISTDIEEVHERAKDIARACRLNPVVCAGLVEELERAPQRVGALQRASELLKEELEGVIHPSRRGVCVGIGLERGDPKKVAREAKARGLTTDLGSAFLTACPRYERFLRKGIVVELKKLEVLEMGDGEVLSIADTLKKCV